MKKYIKPIIEVVEVEIEDAILEYSKINVMSEILGDEEEYD